MVAVVQVSMEPRVQGASDLVRYVDSCEAQNWYDMIRQRCVAQCRSEYLS